MDATSPTKGENCLSCSSSTGTCDDVIVNGHHDGAPPEEVQVQVQPGSSVKKANPILNDNDAVVAGVGAAGFSAAATAVVPVLLMSLIGTLVLWYYHYRRRNSNSGSGGGNATSTSPLPDSPRSNSTGPKVGLAPSSDCDTVSFSSDEDEQEHPLKEITTATDPTSSSADSSHNWSDTERYRLVQLEVQTAQLMTALQLQNASATGEAGKESLLQQVRRLEAELQQLRHLHLYQQQQQQQRQQQDKDDKNKNVEALQSRMDDLESRLGLHEAKTDSHNNNKKRPSFAATTATTGSMEERMHLLEQQVQLQQERTENHAVGRDLLVQKAVMDLKYQMDDLEERVDSNQDNTELIVSVLENRLDIQQGQHENKVDALTNEIQSVSTKLARVEQENRTAISNLTLEQGRVNTEFHSRLDTLQEELKACQEEWKATLLQGLASWDDKLASNKKSLHAATLELTQQLQGLQEEVRQQQQPHVIQPLDSLVLGSSSFESELTQQTENTTGSKNHHKKSKFKLLPAWVKPSSPKKDKLTGKYKNELITVKPRSIEVELLKKKKQQQQQQQQQEQLEKQSRPEQEEEEAEARQEEEEGVITTTTTTAAAASTTTTEKKNASSATKTTAVVAIATKCDL